MQGLVALTIVRLGWCQVETASVLNQAMALGEVAIIRNVVWIIDLLGLLQRRRVKGCQENLIAAVMVVVIGGVKNAEIAVAVVTVRAAGVGTVVGIVRAAGIGTAAGAEMITTDVIVVGAGAGNVTAVRGGAGVQVGR